MAPVAPVALVDLCAPLRVDDTPIHPQEPVRNVAQRPSVDLLVLGYAERIANVLWLLEVE